MNRSFVERYVKAIDQATKDGNHAKLAVLYSAYERKFDEQRTLLRCLSKLSAMVLNADTQRAKGGYILLAKYDDREFAWTWYGHDDEAIMNGGIVHHDTGQWCIHT